MLTREIWSPALLTRMSSRPKCFDRLGDQPVHRAALADVALDQDGLAAATLDLRGDLLRLLAATAVVNRDVSTAFAQPARGRRADTAARTRDEAGLALDLTEIHVRSPVI